MIRKRKQAAKRPTKAKIEKECLALWSRCVRTRDRKCRVTGSDVNLQAHHIRSRSNKATYLDLENGMALASKFHILQKFKPEYFQDRIIEVIGDQEYQRLKVKSQRIWKPTTEDLIMMRDSLKLSLRQLTDEYGAL